MTIKNPALFRVLLNRFHPHLDEKLLACLPKEESKQVLSETINAQDPIPFLTWPEDLIAHTHYSWLAPIIRKLPSSLRALTIAALPEPQSSKLHSFLHVASPPFQLASSIKKFFVNVFFREWSPKEIKPLSYLPESQLNPLLKLSKDDLVEFINLLAIYDLAEALRNIVDKKLLESIYHCLSGQQQEFLRFCLRNREKPTAPLLELNKWDGQQESFQHLMHRRGLLRFGKALCGESREFIWYLTHILDTGRGEALARHYKEKTVSKIHEQLNQQLLSVLNFLKNKGTI